MSNFQTAVRKKCKTVKLDFYFMKISKYIYSENKWQRLV